MYICDKIKTYILAAYQKYTIFDLLNHLNMWPNSEVSLLLIDLC